MAFKNFKPMKVNDRGDSMTITVKIVDDVHGDYHTELHLDSVALSMLPSQAAARKAAIERALKSHVKAVHTEWAARRDSEKEAEEAAANAVSTLLDDNYDTL